MQRQHDAASHSPTHDTHDRMMMCNRRILQILYFIMITTATYLWNKPRKHVLGHMHPTEHVKKYKTIVNNAPAFTYLSLYSCARHPPAQH